MKYDEPLSKETNNYDRYNKNNFSKKHYISKTMRIKEIASTNEEESITY